jgi:hypothetical protein
MLAGDIDETGWAERAGWTGRATSIDPPRLDRDGLQQLLHANRETLRFVGSGGLVDELLRLTQGDPLLVRMYVEALHGKGVGGAFLEIKDLPAVAPIESRLDDAMYPEQIVRTIARFIVGDGRRKDTCSAIRSCEIVMSA